MKKMYLPFYFAQTTKLKATSTLSQFQMLAERSYLVEKKKLSEYSQKDVGADWLLALIIKCT